MGASNERPPRRRDVRGHRRADAAVGPSATGPRSGRGKPRDPAAHGRHLHGPRPRRRGRSCSGVLAVNAAAIAVAVRGGKLKAVDVAEKTLAGIAERDPALNAFTAVLAERA